MNVYVIFKINVSTTKFTYRGILQNENLNLNASSLKGFADFQESKQARHNYKVNTTQQGDEGALVVLTCNYNFGLFIHRYRFYWYVV